MIKRISATILLFLIVPWQCQSFDGMLRVHPTNKRYFTDNSGKAIYLTGSHTWEIVACDITTTCYHYDDYLTYMQNYGFNFLRLWISKEIAWNYDANKVFHYIEPMIYERTGPGNALDGKLKFDLTKFNPVYINKLKNVISSAQSKGIYVSLMLFEGWWNADSTYRTGAWHGHPFNPGNNINVSSATITNIHTLSSPQVVDYQKRYVRAIIDAVNVYDNIIYEIANEDAEGTTAWQINMMDYVRQYEMTKSKQHLVWLTTQSWGTSDNWLWSSTADTVSPTTLSSWNSATEPYIINPPLITGSKPVILDTDHFLGRTVATDWPRMILKSFMRGYNPIIMDPYLYHPTWTLDAALLPAASHTMIYAKKMNMAKLIPSNSTSDCSTTYCLRNAGYEYLAYQPSTGAFTLNLTAGNYNYEWFNIATGKIVSNGSITASSGSRSFTPPFSGQAFLYLKVKNGDLNNDGKVDIADYSMFIQDFGKTGANLPADLNNNGQVEIGDYSIFISNFGKTS